MEITEIQLKGSHLNTMEKFRIYNDKLKGITVFNENLYELCNPIFYVCGCVQDEITGCVAQS
jgi:hypothetical protein